MLTPSLSTVISCIVFDSILNNGLLGSGAKVKSFSCNGEKEKKVINVIFWIHAFVFVFFLKIK